MGCSGVRLRAFRAAAHQLWRYCTSSGRWETRFTDLHTLLGLSTRTLSDKLKTLMEAGLVDRRVFDEQPVRIEYFLTPHGIETAALAGPLFAHLNLQALKEAGRIR